MQTLTTSRLLGTWYEGLLRGDTDFIDDHDELVLEYTYRFTIESGHFDDLTVKELRDSIREELINARKRIDG